MSSAAFILTVGEAERSPTAVPLGIIEEVIEELSRVERFLRQTLNIGQKRK
jgi:hypothetical protein